MEHLGSSDSSSPQVSHKHTPDRMSNTFKYRTPIGFDFVSSPSCRGFYISKTEDSDSSFSLSPDSCSESIMMSSNTLIVSPVVDDALKHKIEEKESDMSSQQNDSNIQTADLETEKAKVDKLRKQVDELNVVILDSNLKIKSMEEDLQTSRELNLQTNEYMLELFLLKTSDEEIHDKQMKESNMKICRYMSEISKLKSTLEGKDEISKAVTDRLRMKLMEKCNAVADLNKKLDALTLEKDGVNAQLDALRTEKCSRERLIQAEILNLRKEVQSLTDENRALKQEIQENGSNIIAQNADLETEQLKRHVADLKLINSGYNLKVKSIKEELEVSNDETAHLKQELFNETRRFHDQYQSDQQLVCTLQKKIDFQRETIHGLLERVTNEVSVRDDRITELNAKNNEYMSEISLLKTIHKLNKDSWSLDIQRLKTELNEKRKLVDDLKRSLNCLKLEKNRISVQFDTLQRRNDLRRI